MRLTCRACALALLLSLAFAPAWAQAPLSEADRAAVQLTAYGVAANQTYLTASNTELKLDVYRPPTATEKTPVPVLVFIHGGGWIGGTKEGAVLQLLPYLERGFAAVNVEYRLGRVARAPAAVEDCRCALRWIVRNAKRFGFDTSRIVVTGGSAGGHLALTTGFLRASDGLDYECGGAAPDTWANDKPEPEPKVAAIVNLFGITDVNAMLEGGEARGYAVEWLGSRADREQVAKRVSPLTYVRPGVPPVITIHGDNDKLVPYAQAVRLHDALKKAGVANKLVTIPGGGHGGFTADQDATAYTAIFDFLVAEKVMEPAKK